AIPRADERLLRVHQHVERAEAVDGAEPGAGVLQPALQCGVRRRVAPAEVVRGIAVLVVHHPAFGEQAPPRVTRDAVAGRDTHHPVRRLRTVQRAGGRPLDDLDVGDVLRVDVVDARGRLAAGADGERVVAALHADAIDVIDRLVGERETGLAANADARPRA